MVFSSVQMKMVSVRIYGVCTLVAHAAKCQRPASVGPHCQARCSHQPSAKDQPVCGASLSSKVQPPAKCQRPASVGPHCQARCIYQPSAKDQPVCGASLSIKVHLPAKCQRPASVGPHCQARCSHHPRRQFSLEGLNLQLDNRGGIMQPHILCCLKRLQSDHKCHHLYSQTTYAIILIVRPQMPSSLYRPQMLPSLWSDHICHHPYSQTTNVILIVRPQMPSSLQLDHKCYHLYSHTTNAIVFIVRLHMPSSL